MTTHGTPYRHIPWRLGAGILIGVALGIGHWMGWL